VKYKKTWLSVPEFAKHIGKSEWWVKRRLAEGHLESVPDVNQNSTIQPLIHIDSLDLWAEKQKGASSE
jgi:hypothetical protein|tara:strand:- start:6980 stop:7183 length:204 start_codon:yes stop_codon:yes gene_type:complete